LACSIHHVGEGAIVHELLVVSHRAARYRERSAAPAFTTLKNRFAAECSVTTTPLVVNHMMLDVARVGYLPEQVAAQANFRRFDGRPVASVEVAGQPVVEANLRDEIAPGDGRRELSKPAGPDDFEMVAIAGVGGPCARRPARPEFAPAG
jgi:hypothetical protein